MSKQFLTTHTVDNAHVADIFSLAATPTAIFSAGGSSTLHIHRTTDPTFPRAQSIQNAHRLGAHHVVTARGGRGSLAVTAGFGGEVKLWSRDYSNADAKWTLRWEIVPKSAGNPGDGAGDVWAIALSADERYLACTTHDGRIVVWDVDARETVQTYETGGSGGGSFGMAVDLSRDGRLTASGHQSGAVYVFNNDAGRLVYSLAGMARPIRTVAFSPGCKLLAAAGNAGIIAFYDMEHGEYVGNLMPSSTNNAWITCLDWNDTGDYLLSGSLDGLVKVWDVNTRVCVATHNEIDKALWSVRWLPRIERAPAAGMGKGEMFAVAGANRSITFYREASGI